MDRCVGSSHLGDGSAVPTPVSSPRVVARVLPLCSPSSLIASGARAATRTRGQESGTTLPTTYSGDGRWENHPPVDSLRAALVPLAKGVRLSVIEARWGAVSCRGEMGRVLAEALGGSLVRGREGHSGLPHHKNRPEGGLQKANRILHHVQWQRPCKFAFHSFSSLANRQWLLSVEGPLFSPGLYPERKAARPWIGPWWLFGELRSLRLHRGSTKEVEPGTPTSIIAGRSPALRHRAAHRDPGSSRWSSHTNDIGNYFRFICLR
jgi:hypothetical protein